MYSVDIGFKKFAFYSLEDAIKAFNVLNKGIEIEFKEYEKREDGTPDYSKALYTTTKSKITVSSEQINFDESEVPF